jgi:DNA-binding response OmpR family regulator
LWWKGFSNLGILRAVQAASKQQPGKGRPLSILVADDEQDTVTTLTAILEDEGHMVHVVTHGALVREAIRRFKPEVCILDIEMPGETGYAIAQHITEAHKSNRPVLIAITGKWKSQTDMLLARMVGFDHFFLKPADPNLLIAVLDGLRAAPPPAAA